MAKRNLFPVLGLAALLLSSCGGTSSDSETPPSEGSASLSDVSSSLGEESSSDTGTWSSDGPFAYSWPAEEITSYIVSHLGAETDIEVPTPSEAVYDGQAYELTLETSEDGTASILMDIEGDFSAYGDEIMATGEWLSPSYRFADGFTLYHGTDYVLEMRLYPYDEEEDVTELTIALSTGNFAVWPEAIIEGYMDDLFGENCAPLPILEGASRYVLLEPDRVLDTWDYFYFYVCDVPPKDYDDLLLENGFHPDVRYGCVYYIDPTISYSVRVWDFYEEVAQFCLEVATINWHYTLEAETLEKSTNNQMGYVWSDNLPAIPTYDFDFDCGWTESWDIGENWVRTYTYKFDEDGNMLDIREDYIPSIDASEDWVWDEGLGCWTDTVIGKLTLDLWGPEDIGASMVIVIDEIG